MDLELIIIVSVFGSAWLVLLIMCFVLFIRVQRLQRLVQEIHSTRGIRVQKLKKEADNHHAYHNPTISPDEELSRRGYSMYVQNEDVECGQPRERQTGGLVEDLARELELRQQKQSTVPPFLLQGIEDNKRKTRVTSDHSNNDRNARKSSTNNNFFY